MTLEDISKALIDLDVDGIADSVKSELDKGIEPQEILSAFRRNPLWHFLRRDSRWDRALRPSKSYPSIERHPWPF